MVHVAMAHVVVVPGVKPRVVVVHVTVAPGVEPRVVVVHVAVVPGVDPCVQCFCLSQTMGGRLFH